MAQLAKPNTRLQVTCSAQAADHLQTNFGSGIGHEPAQLEVFFLKTPAAQGTFAQASDNGIRIVQPPK